MFHVRYRFLALLLALAAGCSSLPRSSPREDRLLNSDWKFIRQDVPGGEAPDADDSSWQRVSVPHTWNGFDGQDGGGDYHRGPAWYRLHLDVPPALAGKSLFLRFEAAATATDVFVNGQSAGPQHRGNFGAFCYDVTALLKPGASNVIAVRVDNSKFDDVAPLSGDFTVFGGIYRDVHLLALDPLSISPMDDASPGVYLKQSRVDAVSADVEVTAKLRNGSSASRTATVVCTIADRDGNVVKSVTTDQPIAPRQSADAVLQLKIDRPHLWQGREDPYLYTAVVAVYDEHGRACDRVVQPLGLRSYRVDPEYGLLLNGTRYPLHGVNRHQDRPDKGWAISRADHDEDFRMIADIGATGVRLAHYQHADYAYQLCDQLGLVVWAELPLVNDIAHNAPFAANAKQQLRELIKQNANHPSILFWSLYNELALAKPDFADEQKLITDLNDQAYILDPTRLTTAATHKQKIDHPVNWIPDVTAFNRYYGWYQGQPQDWAAGLDDMHARLPGKRVGISEYGAGASIDQHEASPTKPRTAGWWHPEEWQAICHEAAWDAMKRRPWLWGTFVWNMFDFSADERAEGDHLGRNDKGLVTYDRQTRKDAFYFYQANWTSEPIVHITSRRFTPRPAVRSEVKIYSNCDSVELFLNGRSLGRSVPGDNRIVRWPNVPLREGLNVVRAVGHEDGKRVSDEVTWLAARGAATRLSTTAPATTRATRPATVP